MATLVAAALALAGCAGPRAGTQGRPSGSGTRPAGAVTADGPASHGTTGGQASATAPTPPTPVPAIAWAQCPQHRGWECGTLAVP
ncbi:MAG: hypothetical protein ACHQNA_09570, partial [Acidimicrobiales bacterium]